MNLIAQLDHIVNRSPEQTAIIFGDIQINYQTFHESVGRLAQAFKELGITKGDRIAILLPNVPHFCISYYAALTAGGVIVPINFMNNVNEIMHQLSDSEARTVISWHGFHKQVAAAAAAAPFCENLIFLGETIPQNSLSLTQLLADHNPIQEKTEIYPEDLAAINYTSGIADVPLGAELTHYALLDSAATCREMFLITDDKHTISALPLFHPLGQTLIMNATFIAGGTIVLQAHYSPEKLIQTIQNSNTHFMAAVPGVFRAMNNVTKEETELPSLKYCLSYGGKLDADTTDRFEKKYNAHILNSYGLTEAGPLVTCTRINRERKYDSCGLPLVGTEIQIRDDDGNILPPNSPGEICVRNSSLMRGYHNYPNETAQRLIDGWLLTGDIGYIDMDHYLYVTERKEDIILKGGFYIYPTEVEKRLLEHPKIQEAAVVAVPDPVQGSEVKAFVILKKSEEMQKQKVVQHCRETLAVYKCPKYVEFLPELPKSATGRVLKRHLRQASVLDTSENK
ncbi:MAG: AMP-binding protein [candidate division KSB1 bacterium]|nr:AMP-binding protein [candidate division KSB1 bacterium]